MFGPKVNLLELRIYKMHPHRFPDYLALTKAKLHLRTAHSPLLGFWATEVGGQNEVVHLWGYESLTQRQAVRQSLLTASEWQNDYMVPVRPMWQSQENWAVIPVASTKEESEAAQARLALPGTNFYRLSFQEGAKTPAGEGDDVVVVASGEVVLGAARAGTRMVLSASKNMDRFAVEAPQGTQWSRLLIPTPWSGDVGAQLK